MSSAGGRLRGALDGRWKTPVRSLGKKVPDIAGHLVRCFLEWPDMKNAIYTKVYLGKLEIIEIEHEQLEDICFSTYQFAFSFVAGSIPR